MVLLIGERGLSVWMFGGENASLPAAAAPAPIFLLFSPQGACAHACVCVCVAGVRGRVGVDTPGRASVFWGVGVVLCTVRSAFFSARCVKKREKMHFATASACFSACWRGESRWGRWRGGGGGCGWGGGLGGSSSSRRRSINRRTKGGGGGKTVHFASDMHEKEKKNHIAQMSLRAAQRRKPSRTPPLSCLRVFCPFEPTFLLRPSAGEQPHRPGPLLTGAHSAGSAPELLNHRSVWRRIDPSGVIITCG